jgi:hypothetical protein
MAIKGVFASDSRYVVFHLFLAIILQQAKIFGFEFLCPVVRVPNQFYLQEDTAVNLFQTWNLRKSSINKEYGKLFHCAPISRTCQECIDCFQSSSDCTLYGANLAESFNVDQTGLFNNTFSSISVRATFQATMGELFLGLVILFSIDISAI